MPLTVKQLQERRAPIGADIRKMADTLGESKPDFTAEERGKWDALNADFTKLTNQIEIARQAEEVTSALERSGRDGPKPGNEDTEGRSKPKKGEREEVGEFTRAMALQAWCRKQHGMELTQDHRRACKRVGLNPNQRVLEVSLTRRPGVELSRAEKRALSAANPTAGAYTIPEGFVRNLEVALKDYNGVRQVADVMRTEDGATMPWPTSDDTANEGEMIGENTEVAEQNVKFGVKNFQAYKFTSKRVNVPSELMDDSAFELASWLPMVLGERIGRGQERKFTTGLGAGEPEGIVTASKLGKTATSATAIAADDIIDLLHSIDPAYRRDPSFGLMMHELILAVVRKLKDGSGRYLFEEGQGRAPDRIKGARVTINQNMDSTVASGKRTMIAGAFKKFKIRDVKRLRIKRLDERYAELDQTAFLAFMRSDSKLLDAGTGPVKHMAH